MANNNEKPSYGPWEYHPVYGCYSRLVYKNVKFGRGTAWRMVGRQYGNVKR